MNGLKCFWVQVIDEIGNPIESGLSVSISTPAIYADDSGTVKTNPITGTITNGVVQWYQTPDTADVIVSMASGGISIKRTLSATTADHRMVLPAQMSEVEALGAMPKIDFFEDFHDYTSTQRWTAVVTGTGACALLDTGEDNAGLMQITCDATDDDGDLLKSTNLQFGVQADKNFFFDARVKHTEGNVDDANVAIGLSTVLAANTFMQVAGAGPPATYDGLLFFKVDGGTVWQFEASNASTQSANTDLGTHTSGAWERLSFKYDYNDGVTANITPYFNGKADTPVTLTIAGLDPMTMIAGVLAGSGAVETLIVDYLRLTSDR